MSKRRHYDNKNDLLRRLRQVERAENRANCAVASSWSAFMMLGLLTLYEDLGFREKRLTAFIDGVHKRNEQFENGEMTLEDIQKKLYDEAGIIVELPKQ